MAIADKFYTKKEIADKCFLLLKNTLNLNGEELFLEPTAGNGVFLSNLKNYEAYDLIPEDSRIKQLNIFDFNSNKKYITIGNPPFGKRSKLAINIFNYISKFSDVIAFILPVSFQKYGVQKELNKDFKLIKFEYLPEYSFLDREKDYDINCVFQIWVRNDYNNMKDLRIKKSPPISNEDFEIWQYNATPESFNCVDKGWELAVYRQGYKDYNKKFFQTDKQEIIEEMKKNIQFFFIKPKTNKSRKIIYSMDFKNLAARNTSTPGFGKADFVSYYLELCI